jgi:hypothetical protein
MVEMHTVNASALCELVDLATVERHPIEMALRCAVAGAAEPDLASVDGMDPGDQPVAGCEGGQHLSLGREAVQVLEPGSLASPEELPFVGAV